MIISPGDLMLFVLVLTLSLLPEVYVSRIYDPLLQGVENVCVCTMGGVGTCYCVSFPR